MDETKVSELYPVGFELFQDSESFMDELSDGWELDFIKDASASIVISNTIGCKSLPLDFFTNPVFVLKPTALP